VFSVWSELNFWILSGCTFGSRLHPNASSCIHIMTYVFIAQCTQGQEHIYILFHMRYFRLGEWNAVKLICGVFSTVPPWVRVQIVGNFSRSWPSAGESDFKVSPSTFGSAVPFGCVSLNVRSVPSSSVRFVAGDAVLH
jgi:hypothetical protein